MNPRLSRILCALSLVVWGAILLYFYGSGRIVKYLAPDFRFIALAGGLGLGVLGLFNLLTFRHGADCGHDHACGDHDHETPDLHPLAAFLLMIVPIGLSVAWTKDDFSTAAIMRKGLYDSAPPTADFLGSPAAPLTLEDIERTYRRTADGALEIGVLELYFAAGDRELQKIFDGLKVEVTGRMVEEKLNNPNGTRKRLFRMFMTCCAADSRAIPVVLEFGEQAPDFPESSWVKVGGTVRYPVENGQIQPLIEVERIESTEAPYEEMILRNN